RLRDHEQTGRDPGAKGNVAARTAGPGSADRAVGVELHPHRSCAVVASPVDSDQRFDGAFRRDLARVALSRLATLAHPGRNPGDGGLRDDRFDETPPGPAEFA